jgi:chromosome segregation ATPase
MEFEQIIKRLEWLDEEHRKDKAVIKGFEDKILLLEGDLDALKKQNKDLSQQISDVTPLPPRVAQFEEIITKQRSEMNKKIEEQEKNALVREQDAQKRLQDAVKEINSSLPKLNQSEDIGELRTLIKKRSDEDLRLNVIVTDLKSKVDDAIRKAEDSTQASQLVEDSRRQDVKRVADMQGEITALRKRLDDFRVKTETYSDSIRNIENRFTELLTSEKERKQAQIEFIDQQTMAQVERDRAYKDWHEKFEEFGKQANTLDTQTQALDETLRAAKRAQETYLELNQKLERRINEVTEMQRLGEDRIRQEWVTFKADDQKRWTGYNLSQEEAIRDLRKSMTRLEERVTEIDDSAQTLQDQLHQTTDATEQQLQELMNILHEWLTAYERIMGHVRKTV